MQIIVIRSRLAQAKPLTFTSRHLVLALTGLVVAWLLGTAFLYYISFRYAADMQVPVVRNLLQVVNAEDMRKKDQFMRENLNAMAVKLGEMQAQLLRLDALGERVSGLAGIKTQDLNFREKPGQGGAVPSVTRDVGMPELHYTLDQLSKDVERRSDYMAVIETELVQQKVKNKMLPTARPINGGFSSSGYGWRIDPFTGQAALHEGVDFVGPVGTPILAAANGVVITAEFNPAFGNMVEIDHGNGLVTRYAHSSKLLVKSGDIVKRNQKIAEIGSTGRSTGPHLHFEVHVNGVARDPSRYLAAGGALSDAQIALGAKGPAAQ
ncbi:MAG: M23 family metallopeptidase [Burkholderiaceae bacterium]|nr:MAG: M23 family metallopeptidase [Burkholderiaceae bacterium]